MRRRKIVPYITSNAGKPQEIALYYEVYGSGKPIVLVQAYSMSCLAWEKQVRPLVAAGFQVIMYDRRGFGGSGRSSGGYDLDTLASDLHAVVETLDLRQATLVGHSMGGAEVVRCLSRYGTSRVAKTVYISAVNPYLVKTKGNPSGMDVSGLRAFQLSLVPDRPAALATNLVNFYTAEGSGVLVSEEKLQADFVAASQASPIALYDCVEVWFTDVRRDHEAVQIPSLVIHGTADVSIPIRASGRRTAQYANSCLIEIEGAPHGLIWTHADQVNAAIVNFLKD